MSFVAALPRRDVALLHRVCQLLAAQRMHVYRPGSHRSSSALVLRFPRSHHRHLLRELRGRYNLLHRAPGATTVPLEGRKPEAYSLETEVAERAGGSARAVRDFIDSLLREAVTETSGAYELELLCVKRRDADLEHRWSGAVTFPGGRRDVDDASDYAAVCRATEEMLGIPLSSPEFLCLGQMQDVALRSRLITEFTSAVQSRFVFLHVGELAPTLQYAAHEVERARWVPLQAFFSLENRGTTTREEEMPAGYCQSAVALPLARFVYTQDADKRLLLSEFFPGTQLLFPALYVPGSDGAAVGGSAIDSGWKVWGLTLRTTSELLGLAGHGSLDWPLFTSTSGVVNFFVAYPLHGCLECVYAYYSSRAGPAVEGEDEVERRLRALPRGCDPLLLAVPGTGLDNQHVGAFVFVCCGTLVVLYGVAAALYHTCRVFRAVLRIDNTDREAADEARLAYYRTHGPASVERERREHQQRQQTLQAREERGDAEGERRATAPASELPEGLMRESRRETNPTHSPNNADVGIVREETTPAVAPPAPSPSPPPFTPPSASAAADVMPMESVPEALNDVLRRYL